MPHSGYEVDYEGDAFFYAFSTAPGGCLGDREAMAALADGPIRVRVGLHTGEPLLDPPRYVGMDVHLAARIMQLGARRPGLLSPATARARRQSSCSISASTG